MRDFIAKDDKTEDNRVQILEELYSISTILDENAIAWINLAGGDIIYTIIKLGLIERVNLPSIDADADNWQKYFKRQAYRITEKGKAVLNNQRKYIHEGIASIEDVTP